MFGRLTEWLRRGASAGFSAEIVSSFEDDDRPVHRYRAEGPHDPDGRADVLIRQSGRDLAILRFDEGVGEGDHPDAAFVLCEVHPQAQHLVFVSFGLGYVVDLNDLDHCRQLGAGWIGSFYDRQTAGDAAVLVGTRRGAVCGRTLVADAAAGTLRIP